MAQGFLGTTEELLEIDRIPTGLLRIFLGSCRLPDPPLSSLTRDYLGTPQGLPDGTGGKNQLYQVRQEIRTNLGILRTPQESLGLPRNSLELVKFSIVSQDCMLFRIIWIPQEFVAARRVPYRFAGLHAIQNHLDSLGIHWSSIPWKSSTFIRILVELVGIIMTLFKVLGQFWIRENALKSE